MTLALHTNYACKKTFGNSLFQRSFIFFISFLLLFFFSCKTTNSTYTVSPLTYDELLPFSPEEIDWQNVGEGIDSFAFSNRTNAISYTIVRINLESPHLEIVTLKSSNKWQNSCSVKSFAKKSDALVAINTSPFHIKNYILPWSKGIAIGLVISEKKVLVEPNETYSALAFYRDENSGFWSAKIFDRQTDVFQEEKLPCEAFGGFWTILRDGKIRMFGNSRDCRSAVATSDSGKTLYVFAGKNLTYGECALIFERLGCEVAMQFDGGSSSQLVVRGKNTVYQTIPRRVVAIVGFRLIP
ncbi:MAG: phosphodiester glycosidase family protein [Treponemataceae bacterium]|nr:phosphodiester glycosidase family protein [Treponemataceae bacterium]